METGLFSMTIVQIAISVVISWALFALLCSMIQEMIVQIKSERGRFMKTKVLDKLYDSTNQINWGLMIYNHSNLKLLTKSNEAPPSDISSKTLAESLIDSMAFAHATQILKNNSKNYIPQFKSDILNNLHFATHNLGQSDVVNMLKIALNKAIVRATTTIGVDEEKLYNSLVEDTQIWFDEFGKRTSVWYKKTSQKRLFLLGLIIASLANVDSLTLINYFKENPNARTGMINFYTKNKIELENLSEKYRIKDSTAIQTKATSDNIKPKQIQLKENTTIKTDSTKAKQEVSKESKAIKADSTKAKEIQSKENSSIKAESVKISKIKQDIQNVTAKINTLKNQTDLPIGWDKSKCTTTDKGCNCVSSSITWCLFYKIIGFIISALAASLGAPFWFDLLKKTTTSIIKK